MAFVDELKAALGSAGAGLIGFADLSALPAEVRDGFPLGISIGVPLNPMIVAQISEGPTREYSDEYDRVNARLDAIGRLAVDRLTRDGHKSAFYPSTDHSLYDRAKLSMRLPHKTVATRAGLGWIGKCALLITREFGPAVRITSVLTDAPLPAAAPVDASSCGKCTDCVAKCPAHAPSGQTWKAGMKRESFFDAFACQQNARAMMLARVGVDKTICGMCIAACPWTRRYLSRAAA